MNARMPGFGPIAISPGPKMKWVDEFFFGHFKGYPTYPTWQSNMAIEDPQSMMMNAGFVHGENSSLTGFWVDFPATNRG